MLINYKIQNYSILTLLFILIVGCEKNPPQYPTTYSRDGLLEYSKRWNKALLEQENQYFQQYVLNHPDKVFEKTNSGFLMTLTQNDSSKVLKKEDTISYIYQIKDLQDSIIYSYSDIGVKKAVVGKSHIILGLEYTLKRMNPGERAIALIPSVLAYGAKGDGQKISPHQPIVVEVETLNNNK